jgi:hypothetical protein
VETGSEEESAGYWYACGDGGRIGNTGYHNCRTEDANGGLSTFVFPSDVEVNTYDNFFGPLVEAYQGIKGRVTLNDGYDYPFAYLAFDLVSANKEGMDISAWGGLCLVYESTISFGIELGPDNESVVTRYDNYKASVAKSASTTYTDFSWAKFKQGGWGQDVNQATVLSQVATIRIKFEGTAGTSGDFIIRSIGRLGTCK